MSSLSISTSGQEANLVQWGNFAHPNLHGCDVHIFRVLRGSQGEVLQNGGEEEE